MGATPGCTPIKPRLTELRVETPKRSVSFERFSALPVPRDALALEFGELVGDAAHAFRHTLDAVNAAPGAYRRYFRVPKPGRG